MGERETPKQKHLASGGGVRSRLETSPAAVKVRSLNNCRHTFGLYYKTIKKREILRI